MNFLTDWITEFLKGLLVDGIMSNLGGLFDSVNNQVGEVAAQVGTSPAAWNPGIFSMLRNLSETVILPIAGLILTFIATYELISLIIEKNNLHDVDTWIFFKWVFKTFLAVMILSNTFNIVMAVFDVAQHVVNSSAGLIAGNTAVTLDMLADLEATLQGMDIGPLIGLWLQTIFVGLTMQALNIVIFIIVYGRLIEIYMLTSLAPIPLEAWAYVHSKIRQVEHENVGTEAAHKTELAGETAVRGTGRFIKHRIHARPIRRVHKLETREISTKADYAYRLMAFVGLPCLLGKALN